MKKGTKKYLRAIKGDCTHLKVETYYNIGGMNYFSGNAEKRGLYISVSPVSRSEHEVVYGVNHTKGLVVLNSL